MTNKYRLERCEARIRRCNFDGAESDARCVLNNCKYFPLARTRRVNGNTSECALEHASSARASSELLSRNAGKLQARCITWE